MERKKQNMLTMQKENNQKNKLKNRTKKGETTFLDRCVGVETQKHGGANKDLKADGGWG